MIASEDLVNWFWTPEIGTLEKISVLTCVLFFRKEKRLFVLLVHQQKSAIMEVKAVFRSDRERSLYVLHVPENTIPDFAEIPSVLVEIEGNRCTTLSKSEVSELKQELKQQQQFKNYWSEVYESTPEISGLKLACSVLKFLGIKNNPGSDPFVEQNRSFDICSKSWQNTVAYLTLKAGGEFQILDVYEYENSHYVVLILPSPERDDSINSLFIVLRVFSANQLWSVASALLEKQSAKIIESCYLTEPPKLAELEQIFGKFAIS